MKTAANGQTSSLDLPAACGQLLLGKLAGKVLDQETRDLLSEGIIGGITLFKENLESAEQLISLCDSIKEASKYPCIIAVDQEGGAVQRLDGLASPIPSMMAMGSLDDEERLKMVIALSAKQMRLLGINCVLAPVADLHTNESNPIIGTRALSGDPDKAARLASLIIKTYLESGILPVIKHFPGHGDTDLDSHFELPKVAHTLSRLESIELHPFRENMVLAPALMVAHLWIESIDPEPLPASLSYNVTTKLLKDELGFQRLVFSDDMTMKAITKNWDLTEACLMAVEAGVDQLLVCTSEPLALRQVYEKLFTAFETGRISSERLSSALRARHAALARLPGQETNNPAKRLLLLQKSMAASDSLLLESSKSAIKVLRGSLSQVIEDSREIRLYIPEHERYRLDFFSALKSEMPELEQRLREKRYKLNPGEGEIELLRSESQDQEFNLIFVAFRSVLNKGQAVLASALAQTSRFALLVSSDLPSDAFVIKEIANAASLMDPSELAVKAFARKLKAALRNKSTNPSCTEPGCAGRHEPLEKQLPEMKQEKRKSVCSRERSFYKSFVSINLRYGDTDRQGHINNAVYCTLFESGRVAFLFDGQDSVAGPGTAFVIAKISLDYLYQMHFPGTVEIASVILSMGRSSFTVGQAIFFQGKCCSTAESVIVLIDEQSGNPTAINDKLKKRLLSISIS